MGVSGTYLYRPSYGAKGATECDAFDTGLAAADAALVSSINHLSWSSTHVIETVKMTAGSASTTFSAATLCSTTFSATNASAVNLSATSIIAEDLVINSPEAGGSEEVAVVINFNNIPKIRLAQQSTGDVAPGAGVVEVSAGVADRYLRLSHYQYGGMLKQVGVDASHIFELYLGDQPGTEPNLSVRGAGNNAGAIIQARNAADDDGLALDFTDDAKPILTTLLSAAGQVPELGICHPGSGDVVIYTDQVERMRILSGGNIKVVDTLSATNLSATAISAQTIDIASVLSAVAMCAINAWISTNLSAVSASATNLTAINISAASLTATNISAASLTATNISGTLAGSGASTGLVMSAAAAGSHYICATPKTGTTAASCVSGNAVLVVTTTGPDGMRNYYIPAFSAVAYL